MELDRERGSGSAILDMSAVQRWQQCVQEDQLMLRVGAGTYGRGTLEGAGGMVDEQRV